MHVAQPCPSCVGGDGLLAPGAVFVSSARRAGRPSPAPASRKPVEALAYQAGARGAAGQANYGFGNLACSQLCRFRRNAGLPGLAVGWGPVGNVGFVVDNSDSLVRRPRMRLLLCALLDACVHTLDWLGKHYAQRQAWPPASPCCWRSRRRWSARGPQGRGARPAGRAADGARRGAQMFKRVFQLTAQQPIDECLGLLGDVMAADLGRVGAQPIITICRTTVSDQSVRTRACSCAQGRRLGRRACWACSGCPLAWPHARVGPSRSAPRMAGGTPVDGFAGPRVRPSLGLALQGALEADRQPCVLSAGGAPRAPGPATPHNPNATLRAQAAGDDAGGLVAAVLGMLGLEEKDVGETETLESLGMDSMQVAEIRARLQRALGRPIPLEEVGALTVARMREVEAEAGLTPSAKPDAAAPAAADGDAPDEAAAAAAAPEAAARSAEADGAAAPAPAAAAAAAAPKPPAKASSADREVDIGAASPVRLVASAGSCDGPATPELHLRPGGLASAATSSHPSSSNRSSRTATPAASPGVSAPSSPRRVSSQTEYFAAAPAAAVAAAAAAAAAGSDAWQRRAAWPAMTAAGVLYIGAWLGGIGLVAFRLVFAVAAAFGAFGAAALAVPAAWLLIGFGMCAASVVTKRLLAPRLLPRRPIAMYSWAFFRWWLVNRMVGVTSMLFADALRGTPFLVWWFRALGAEIGANAFIDTLDVSDWDLLELGDDVAVGEGATLVAHSFKDGHMHLAPVTVGSGCRLEPFSAALPGLALPAGGVLPALGTKPPSAPRASSKLAPRAPDKRTPAWEAAERKVESERVGAGAHAALQLAGLYLMGLATVPGGYAAFWVLTRVLAVLGAPAALWAHAAGPPVFALVALASPVFAPLLPLLLPVRCGPRQACRLMGPVRQFARPCWRARARSCLDAHRCRKTCDLPLLQVCGRRQVWRPRPRRVLTFLSEGRRCAQGAAGGALAALASPALLAALPLAFVANGLGLAAGMVALKWALVARAPAGMHQRLSWFGLRFWLAQRAVELGYKRFMMLALGTWGVNAYLRALGARIGAGATLRFGNPILAPDMLDLGRGCAPALPLPYTICRRPARSLHASGKDCTPIDAPRARLM